MRSAFFCVAGVILRVSAPVFSGGEAGSGEAAWRFARSRAEFHSRLRRSQIFAWVARKNKRRLNPPEDVRLKQNFSQLLGSFVKYCFYNFSIKFMSFRRPVYPLSLYVRFLQFSLDTSKIKSSESHHVIGKVAQNSNVGQQMAWDFILKHWDVLETR